MVSFAHIKDFTQWNVIGIFQMIQIQPLNRHAKTLYSPSRKITSIFIVHAHTNLTYMINCNLFNGFYNQTQCIPASTCIRYCVLHMMEIFFFPTVINISLFKDCLFTTLFIVHTFIFGHKRTCSALIKYKNVVGNSLQCISTSRPI